MPVPPRVVRRLILDPLAFGVCLALILLSPAVVVVAFLTDLFLPGSWRTLRVTLFLVAYVAFEAIGLAWMFALWVASGFGLRLKSRRMQRAHYGFMRSWLAWMHAVVGSLFGLRIVIEDPPRPDLGPVLVFCRHGGPGNSLMLVGTLMIGYHRRPRIVMLAKLQWEPLFDVMGNRLPNRFIRHDPAHRERYLQEIAELATGLEERDAFVLFPEGRNFTPDIRRRAIAHLRRGGHLPEALKAERMRRVLPPRLGGAAAAIAAAPEADVVFAAHTLLEDVPSIAKVWSDVPLARAVSARYWRVSSLEIPMEKDRQVDWLFAWWGEIDRWIADRRARVGPEPLARPIRHEGADP